MTTQHDERAELIRRVEDLTKRFSEGWHDGVKIDASDIATLSEAAALLEADAKGGEAVAWIDSRDLEALSSYSTQCQVVLHRFPKKAGVALYTTPQPAAQDKLREALKAIKAKGGGDKGPNWVDDFTTTATRGWIADVCDAALANKDAA